MNSLFGFDRPSAENEDLVLLDTAYDNIRFALVRSLLEAEKIPFLVKERGSGGTVKIVTGFSMYGTDVFVRREDGERAAALLEAYLHAPDGEEIPEDEEKDV